MDDSRNALLLELKLIDVGEYKGRIGFDFGLLADNQGRTHNVSEYVLCITWHLG